VEKVKVWLWVPHLGDGWRSKSLNAPTIIRERKLRIRDVWAPAALIVAACFFESLPLGVCVTIALALAFLIYGAHDGALPQDQLPIVLEVSTRGLSIRHRWPGDVEIPWQDVEAVRLSRGAKGAVNLDVRVTEPERYLKRLMRLNRVASKYHLSVRVSGLELPPEKIALAIEEARRSFLKGLPDQKWTG